jgi:hypothetical protein
VKEYAGTWTNGKIYSIDNALGRQTLSVAGVLQGEGRFSRFFKQLQDNGLVTGDGTKQNPWEIKTLTEGAHVMVFAPTNAALGTTVLTADALRYCFVPLEDNALRQYLFPGMMAGSGRYKTLAVDSVLTTDFQLVYRQVGIEQVDAKRLQVVDETGRAVAVARGIPLFARDGVIHETTDILKLKP